MTLGLLPGGNGVVRTVRLLGLQRALTDVLLQGQRMKPREAKAIGIVDELVQDRESLLAAAHAFIAASRDVRQPWDREGYAIPGGTPATRSLATLLPTFPANLRKQLKGADMPAPKLILAAAVEGAQTDFDNAAKIEARYFVELVTGPVSKNMIKTFFLDLQKLNSGANRPKTIEPWRPRKVGILGAGMMGAGIAYVTAGAGIPCVLKDTTKAKALAGRSYSAKLLEKALAAGRVDKLWAEEVLSAIEATSDAGDLAGCDMIIEAVFEDRVLKAEVTKEAEAHTESGTLMCSNTSTLPITGLAKASRAPQNFVGLHFFSPVDRMPLVEIIVGKETSDETLARAMDFVLILKKTPIVVNDSRGFFTSRVFSAFVMEGIRMVAEGWNPASIEQAALQNGSPVGPLAVCDEVSLELTRKVREQAKKDLAVEGKPAPPASPADEVVERMCLEFGRRGKAAGAGFYDYAVGGKKVLWPGLSKHFVRPERARPTESEFAELKERLQYITSIESLRCLDEGVVRTVADANVGSVLGIGAPARTGGVLQFINHVGVRPFAERARALESAHGERFRPPEALLEAERTGAKFE